ncbi:hypothetical protein EV421DRAFT_1351144 [Armillaria borealis]|uniref:Uncharacterized protein n=1 Tax=Armillaria borealis TaxID=47425 RepID=A0AA39J3J6_9AGAR|nr:hypothetical protein EV421DRAFT_1351144 [Armillaria borealis]
MFGRAFSSSSARLSIHYGEVRFGPIFSDRCSPSQFLGPKRHAEPPCRVEDIAEVGVLVVSHNIYEQYPPSSLISSHANPLHA